MFIYSLYIMKKILYSFMIIFGILSLILPISESKAWNFDQSSPVKIVEDVKYAANKNKSEQVQKTEYDAVSSRGTCAEIPADGRFTIARTLCSLKNLSRDYIQYLMYVGLTAATILLIRNWFKIVTSTDREKQVGVFKKNLLYIVIWVVLLIWFYYIIDIFVSVVNLVTD